MNSGRTHYENRQGLTGSRWLALELLEDELAECIVPVEAHEVAAVHEECGCTADTGIARMVEVLFHAQERFAVTGERGKEIFEVDRTRDRVEIGLSVDTPGGDKLIVQRPEEPSRLGSRCELGGAQPELVAFHRQASVQDTDASRVLTLEGREVLCRARAVRGGEIREVDDRGGCTFGSA